VLLVALFVLAQAAGGGSGSGARPAECAPLTVAASGNVWERAKYAPLRRYCDLLASGAAKLASTAGPAEAREAMANADEASQVIAGRAAPAVLRGRALVALGEWAEAVKAIEGATSIDPHALDDPAALFAWGRALGRVGRAAEAETALHALLPRAAGLAPSERGKAEIEAALLAQARGAAGLDDSIALFRQAARDAQDSLLAVSGMALSLALDRAGEKEESHVDLHAEKRDPREAVVDPRAMETLADVGARSEADALAAFALEARDAHSAHDLWTRYLAGPGGKGPWADHARAQLAAQARWGRGR
jgi:hypothetical protein